MNLGLVIALKKYCRTSSPDIAHIHDPHAHNAWRIATMLGLPVPAIVHRRVDFPVRPTILNHWKYNHASINAVVCVSQAVKRLIEPMVSDKNKLVVLHDAVDIDKFRKLGDKTFLERSYPICLGKIKVACIAALVDHKDVITFIRMVEYLVHVMNRNEFHFFVVGSGPLETELRERSSSSRLQAHLSFTGNRKDIPHILQSLDYFVFTSKMEGFGSTILEVMAAGVPIIATRAGAGAEILWHKKNAMTSPVGDEISLGNALLELQENTALRQRLVEQSQKDIEGYDIDEHVTTLMKLY